LNESDIKMKTVIWDGGEETVGMGKNERRNDNGLIRRDEWR
jgi:hypothetical protein